MDFLSVFFSAEISHYTRLIEYAHHKINDEPAFCSHYVLIDEPCKLLSNICILLSFFPSLTKAIFIHIDRYLEKNGWTK